MGDLSTLDPSAPAGSDYIGTGDSSGPDDASKQRDARLAIVTTFDAEHHLEGPHAFPASTDPAGASTGKLQVNTTDGLLYLGAAVFPVGSSRSLIFSETWDIDSPINSATDFLNSNTIMQDSTSSKPTGVLCNSSNIVLAIDMLPGTYDIRSYFRYFAAAAGGSVVVYYKPDGGSATLFTTLSVTSAAAFSRGSYTTSGVLNGGPTVFTLAGTPGTAQTIFWYVDVSGNSGLGVTGGGLHIERTK